METSNPYYATSIDEDIEYLLKNKKLLKIIISGNLKFSI